MRAEYATRAVAGRRKTIHTDIIEGIGWLIKERDLTTGDRLPTEAELCEMLGVGRGRLREAIRILSALGYVEVRHGGGMFLASDPDPTVLQPLHALVGFGLETQLEILQIRRMIEVDAVEIACRSVRPELTQRLAAVVGELAGPDLTLDELVQADLRFHFAIVQSTDNRTLVRIYANVGALFAAQLRDTLRQPGTQARSHREHDEILKAIESGDVPRARTEMMQHLDIVEGRFREQLRDHAHRGDTR